MPFCVEIVRVDSKCFLAIAAAHTRVRRFYTLLLFFFLICVAVIHPAWADKTGFAHYYGVGDGLAGNRTASGERLDPYAMTCASRHYPLGARLLVTNVANGKQITVRVNDRGGIGLLDLTYGAFRKLSSTGGVINIRVKRLK